MTAQPDSSQCFHCGDPLPPEIDYRVTIAGHTHKVCCRGCQAVAQLIAGADMADFYQRRTEFSPRPDEDTDAPAEWFGDRNWLHSFAESTEGILQLPLLVTGMSCAACAWIIERFVLQQPEVLEARVQLTLGKLTVSLREDADARSVVNTLQALGYGAQPWRPDTRLVQMRRDNHRDLRRLGVAFLGMMQVGMFAIALYAGDLQGMDPSIQRLLQVFSAPITLAVLVYSGAGFFQRAWQHLKQGALIMDTSVALALLLATLASLWATWSGRGETYYDSVTMFIFFLLLARYIERRLRDADLLALVQAADELPEFVAVLRDGHWERRPRNDIAVGDTLRVTNGEAIAFDGLLTGGPGSVDESVFTGESLPRQVAQGDPLYAGTINTGNSLELVVGSTYPESRLAALAADVEFARSEKPAFVRLVDRLAGRFIAFVLLAAAVTCVVWLFVSPEKALWASIAVLVVACPCALSLATPAAVAAGNSRVQQQGVRVRSETGLLAAADVSYAVVDKTGTLTDTQLVLDTLQTHPEADDEATLALAVSLQQFNNHPVARAFEGRSSSHPVADIEAVAGSGITGRDLKSDLRVRMGSENFCRELAPSLPPCPDRSFYWVALVNERHWLAWIGLSESLRTGAEALVEGLRSRHIPIEVLSGDVPARVSPIADHLKLDFRAAQKPTDKFERLKDLQHQGERVLAIGDGVNDAPLLGAADVSVAVATAAAMAQAQADFVIVGPSLKKVPELLAVAKKTRQITRQNLIWAASYNSAGIPLAALGYVPPWAAALGMSISSLLVVLNALRLRRVKV